MKILPQNVSDFVAFAELVNSPAKLQEVAATLQAKIDLLKEQNDRAEDIAEDFAANQETLDEIKTLSKEIEESKKELNKLKAQYQADMNHLKADETRVAGREDVVTKREIELDKKENNLELREDVINKKEKDLVDKETELVNAKKLATEEYEKWKRRNDELERITSQS